MAYLANFLNGEDDPKQQQQTALNTSGVVATPDVTPQSAGTAPAPSASESGNGGTGFVNLQQYLDTNQGKGAAVVGSAASDINDAQQKLGTEAQKTVSDSKTAYDASAGSSAAAAAKTGISNANYSQAQDFLGSKWQGQDPNAAAAGFQASADNLKGQINKFSDPSQIQSNLASNAAKAGQGYSQGMGLLDSFLATGDASGQAAINAVKARSGDVDKLVGSTKDQLSAQQKASQDAFAANQQGVRDAARAREDSIVGYGNTQAAQMNKGLDMSRQEAAQASAYDGLSQGQRDDIAALSRLSGYDPGLKSTYNAGKDPIPPPAPVVTVSPTKYSGNVTTTRYSDGSYDEVGSQGEVIHRNPDGSIKGIENNGVLW